MGPAQSDRPLHRSRLPAVEPGVQGPDDEPGHQCGTALVEEPTSDAATEVWKWILADPEARAWLDGTPDNGMVVNPLYSMNPKQNRRASRSIPPR